MRWTRSWTVAAIFLALAVGMFAWSGAEAERGRQWSSDCRASTSGLLSGIGCMSFAGLEQALAGFALLGCAAIFAAWGGWRIWKTGRPERERAELARIDAELRALGEGDG